MWGYTVLAVLASTLALLYALLKRQMSYWQRRGVPGPTPSWIFGSFADAVKGKVRLSEEFRKYYNEYKHKPYMGLYVLQKPILHVNDPEIIREVFVREFSDFSGRGIHKNPSMDVMANAMFFADGPTWKHVRTKLSPAFSPSKIKYMFSTVKQCAENMRLHLEAKAAAAAAGCSYTDEVRELFARFTTDMISSVAFGIESNSLDNPDSEMRQVGRKVFELSFSNFVRDFVALFGGRAQRWVPLTFRPASVNNFFARVVHETIEYREKNHVKRADIMDLLLQLKDKGYIAGSNDGYAGNGVDGEAEDKSNKFTNELIIAQVFIFFIAGFETTSSAASFSLYEMIKHPEVLKKAIEEVDRVLEKHNGEISFESISEMHYLEQIISESLRLYSPLFLLQRECNTERKLPRTDLVLEKGTQIFMSVDAIHKDPQYWKNPKAFDPDRFSEENKKSIHPMTYLPFGEGPRYCIGMRLAMVNVKMALALIVANFNLSLGPQMPDELTLNVMSILPSPVSGLWITFTSRNKEPRYFK